MVAVGYTDADTFGFLALSQALVIGFVGDSIPEGLSETDERE